MDKKVKNHAHTDFPWRRFDDGGKLPNVYERSGGFRYGPEASDWVWGPKGPGYGVVADCSPMRPSTTESVANAKLIAAIPDMIALAELTCAELEPGHPLRAVAEIVLSKAGRQP
jgi:hypothetical protein